MCGVWSLADVDGVSVGVVSVEEGKVEEEVALGRIVLSLEVSPVSDAIVVEVVNPTIEDRGRLDLCFAEMTMTSCIRRRCMSIVLERVQ